MRFLAGPIAEARFSGEPLANILAGPCGKVDHAAAQRALAAAGRDMPEVVDRASEILSLH
jgi:hypothetical protein